MAFGFLGLDSWGILGMDGSVPGRSNRIFY
jgi:hypothetical protein